MPHQHTSPHKIMTVTETHSWALSQTSPHITAFKLGFSNKLDHLKLQQAIKLAISEQPSLQLTINSNVTRFQPLVVTDWHIHCIHKRDWTEIVEEQLAIPFHAGELLFRIFIVEHHTTELLLFFHHIISDGISGMMFLFQILKHYGYNGEFEFAHTNEIEHLDPLDTDTLSAAENDMIKNHHHTGMLPFVLDATGIMQYCQKNKFRLSHLLGAIAAKTNAELLSNTSSINCYYPYDLRPKKSINAKLLAHYTSWIEFPVDTKTAASLLDLANTIQSRLKQAIHAKDYAHNLKKLNADFQKLPLDIIIANNQRELPTVIVTGVEDMHMFSTIPINDMYMAVNCQSYIANGKSFMLIYNVLNEKIYFNLMYIKSLTAESDVVKLKNKIIAHLTSLEN